jgi:HlyD family secretion protein
VKIEGIAFPHKPIMHVSASLDGRVTEVFIKKGDHVTKGDLLLRYTTDGAQRELRSIYSGVVLSHKVQQEQFSALEPCVYLLPHDQVNQMKEIVAFVSYGDLRKLKVGMEVQVTPSDLKREEVGYMYGHITAINELPTSAKEADMLFKLNEFTTAVFSSEAAFMVQIRREDHPKDKSMIRWSHKGGEDIDMKIGTLCSMQIVTRVRPVYELLFNRGIDN